MTMPLSIGLGLSGIVKALPPAGNYPLQIFFLNSSDNPPYGAFYYSDGSAWNVMGSGGGGTWGSITGTLANQTDLNTALAAKATVGKIGRASDVVAGRAFAATDFGVGLVPINSSSVLAFTLPTVASMALTGSGNILAVQVMGTGIPTFAGATASTTINGVAGTTTVLPLGGAPVQYGIYVFTQVGTTDAWTLG